MPHFIPRYNPALRLAHPSEHARDGWHRDARDPWEIRWGDGTWQVETIRYWHRRQGGGYLCHFHYQTPDGHGYEDWFVADPELMRPIGDEPPQWSPWG